MLEEAEVWPSCEGEEMELVDISFCVAGVTAACACAAARSRPKVDVAEAELSRLSGV